MKINWQMLGDSFAIDGTEYDSKDFFYSMAHTGIHGEEGVIILYGNGVAEGKLLKEHSIKDIGKTILFLEGFPIADDMIGEIIRDAWDAPEITSGKPRTIQHMGAFDLLQQVIRLIR